MTRRSGHPIPAHPVDRARREVILDELRRQASRQEYVQHAMQRWDAQIGLAAEAEAVRQYVRQSGGPLCAGDHRDVDLFLGRDARDPGEPRNARTHLLAEHGAALRRAEAIWKTRAFLSDVVAVLRDDTKFSPSVARMLAPLMLCSYVEWCDGSPVPWSLAKAVLDQYGHEPISKDAWDRMCASAGWAPEMCPPCELLPVCPLRPPEVPRAPDRGRRLPKKRDGHGYLRDRAEWYFEVEIISRNQAMLSFSPGRPARERDPLIAAFIESVRGQDQRGTVRAIARRLHPRSNHRRTEFSDGCGCIKTVKDSIAEVKRLLGL
jgi:hypothetical protein